MFGKNQKFDLQRPPYGREGSGFYLYEDFYNHLIRMSCWKSGEMISRSGFQFDFHLFAGGTEQPYTYFADEGSIGLDCEGGFCEVALTAEDHLRIRGNVETQVVLRPAVPEEGTSACRGIYQLQNGDWEGAFGRFGVLRLRKIDGDVSVEAPWDPAAFRYEKVAFVFGRDGGPYEAALFEDMVEFKDLPDTFRPFDEVVADNRASFALFQKNYRLDRVPEKYKEISRYVAWTIWIHKCKKTGGILEPMIFMHLQWMIIGVSWQQSYNAIATQNNADEAWRLFCIMFRVQDPDTGCLPFGVDYSGAPKGGTPQPPFQGLGFAFIYELYGDQLLTYERCEWMYPRMKKWVGFWLRERSAGRGDDVVAVHSPHEAGWDDASIFRDGFPAANPDVNSFLILCMEALSKMAAVLHLYAEAEEWDARSKKLLNTLITEFWDGEKFITRVNGKPVDSMSAVCYEPIMLGKRLPQEIIDKVAEKLTDEKTFLSPIGITGESMMSPLSGYGNRFILGRVVAPLNMILTLGLSKAGKKKEAAMIAKRFCDRIDQDGVILGFAPYDYYPLTGEKVPDLIDFMLYCFYNQVYKADHLGMSKKTARLSKLGIWGIEKVLRKTAVNEFKKSKHFAPPTPIREIAGFAEPIVSIGNQTGEGWFLTGEMVELIHDGVPNIVCTQPFGCLPNHVVGKGVIKALRKAYPESNIVAIDYDPGASEVNQLNRIKLMLSTAQKNLRKTIPDTAEIAETKAVS